MSILKVPSTQVLMSGRGIVTGGKAGSSRRGHENSGNIPVDSGAIGVSDDGANSTGTIDLTAGQASVGAYQFSLVAATSAAITNQTITIKADGSETFGGGTYGGIVVEHLSTLGTVLAVRASDVLTKFPGYGSVAFNTTFTEMTYQRLKGATAGEVMGPVNVYIRLGTQTLPLLA
jgi:hypothetical protein